MIDLSNTPVISSIQTSSHEESKIIAFHAVRKLNDENIMDKLATSINSTQNNLIGLLDWSGIPLNTYLVIRDEILFLSQISGSNLTVNRGLFGTVATSHNAGEYIYTVDIFQNVGEYNFTEKLGLNDRDLFSVDCGDGTINIYDEPYKWNILASESLYKARRNKEIFIFEGCDKQLIKTYEGVIYQKIGSSRDLKITFQIKNSIWKFLDENIPIIKMYDNIKPKELFEDMFSGYTAKYINDINESTYFKINNISTGEFTTYRDFLNFICKEYGIHILFRKDKTIHITSLINQANITPSVSILTEVTDINDDEANNTIINKVTGSYLERKTLYDENDFNLNNKLQYINFKASKSFTNTTIDIIFDYKFKEITLTGFTDDDIQTMNYKDYMLLKKSNTEQYMCKLTDIIRTSTSPNIYSVNVLCGYEKASYWNERGRLALETNETGNLTWASTDFTLYWVFLELPIVWKYGRKINNEDKYSNIMYPLKPSNEEVIYLEKFGVGDNSNSKFSGIVKGLDGIVNATYMDNSKIYYNKEFSQNDTETPIYLYTNSIDGTKTDNLGIISIRSIDNSNIQVKFENSDIKDNIYKITLKNTKTQSTTYDITPTTVFNGQTLIELSASNYDLCNIGDMLELKSVDSSNSAYSTYLSWKSERWLIDSKFIDSGIYYITVNTPYPLAYGGINFTFTKYNRDDIILLNEFYLRANPVMETSNSYDYKNQPSIDEYGTKELTLEGKATSQADFLKLLSYFKDCFHAMSISAVHNKIRFDLTKRLDLEVGDCIYLSDLLYTKYNNQKVLITQKKVSCDNKGLRTEEYEGMTFGDYTINPAELKTQSSLSYNPITIPKYNHRGTEGSDTASNDSQVDNKRIVIQDDVEGQIFVEQIDTSYFTAKASLSSSIMSNTKTFNIDINDIDGSKSSVYATALLALNSEGIIKISNEYMTYKTISGINAGFATIQIIKRGVGNTDSQDIYNGIRVQFFKILAKQSAEGFKTTAINAGDNVNNYAVVNENVGVQIKGNGNGSGSSYVNLNNGTFQAGRVSNITGKADFNGMYLGDTTIANNKHVYYDGTTVKISANVEIGNSTASTIESNASNAWKKFSGVGNTLPSGNVEFNFATSSTKGGNAINTDNVGTQPASAVQMSTINFNGRNDRNATAIVIPTINTDGTAIDHTTNTDSTCNISFEWNWAGTNADIDGFIVFVRQKSTTSSYTFGSTPSEEQVFYVTPEKRAFILYGVPVNQFYHFGIQAYRIVDTDINSNNVIKTTIIQPSLSNENPYQPSSTVAFAGDVSGTVSGTSASTVVSNALNGQTAYNGTNIIRDTTSSPTNNAVFGSITFNSTSDGNIVANIPYTYTQGTINADSLVFYYKQGGGTVTSSDVAYIKNAVSGNINFILIPNTVYSFGIQAVRKSNNTTIGGSIVQSGNNTTPAGNYTNKINSSDTSNYLYVGSNVKIGKDAYATGKDGVSITTNGYLNVANNNNALYFDPTVNGDLSYLRMNSGSQQIGKVVGLTGKSDFNGIFLGDKNLTNKKYMYYDGKDLIVEGNYINKIAYVTNGVEFIGACDTSKITVKGVNNPFYQKYVNGIVIKNEITDIGVLNNHFGENNTIIPSSDVKFIEGNNLPLWCSYNKLKLNDIKISNINFKNLGFQDDSVDLSIDANNTIFINNSINYVYKPMSFIGNSTIDTIHISNFNIYYLNSGIFLNTDNINNIKIDNTEGLNNVFVNCKNIKNIIINTTSSSIYSIFENCENIDNFYYINLTSCECTTFFYNCKNINNFNIKGGGNLNTINGGVYSYNLSNGVLEGNGVLRSGLLQIDNCIGLSNIRITSYVNINSTNQKIDYNSCDISDPFNSQNVNRIALNEPSSTTYTSYSLPKKDQTIKIEFTNPSQTYVGENTQLDIDSSITGYTYVLNIINDAGIWKMYKVYSSGNMATQVTTYFTVNPNNIRFFIKTDVTTRFMNIVSIGG